MLIIVYIFVLINFKKIYYAIRWNTSKSKVNNGFNKI